MDKTEGLIKVEITSGLNYPAHIYMTKEQVKETFDNDDFVMVEIYTSNGHHLVCSARLVE